MNEVTFDGQQAVARGAPSECSRSTTSPRASSANIRVAGANRDSVTRTVDPRATLSAWMRQDGHSQCNPEASALRGGVRP
jgi:hypothetical protein